MSELVVTAEMVERCVNPSLPDGVIEIDGFRYPLVEFTDDDAA